MRSHPPGARPDLCFDGRPAQPEPRLRDVDVLPLELFELADGHGGLLDRHECEPARARRVLEDREELGGVRWGRLGAPDRRQLDARVARGVRVDAGVVQHELAGREVALQRRRLQVGVGGDPLLPVVGGVVERVGARERLVPVRSAIGGAPYVTISGCQNRAAIRRNCQPVHIGPRTSQARRAANRRVRRVRSRQLSPARTTIG